MNLRWQLDLQLFSQEKTEQATPKKKADARKKGQVAKSMEISSAFILLFIFLFFYMLGDFFHQRFYDLFIVTFKDYMLMDITIENVMMIFRQLTYKGLIVIGPIFLIAIIIGLAANYMQIGFLFTGEPLMMKFNKINPLEGAKRLFSLRALVDLFKSLIKLIIIGAIAFMTIWGEKNQILGLASLPIESIVKYTVHLILLLGIKVSAVLVILAVFDYAYQKYEYNKNLKMSKQDIKDEYKNMEGDPQVKGKIKERQRRMAMQRMMQQVPSADVIITNPTHYAVAVQYDASKMEAPTVIAKGVDYVALKIRERAKEHGILIMENKPLARALYGQVEIGESIPADLFQAVAEILAYVYKMKGKTS